MNNHTDSETYRKGNCHCGAFRFELSNPLDTALTLFSCDCSLCAKQGYMLVPLAQEIRVIQGRQDTLTVYKSSVGQHMFCPDCGTGVLVQHDDAGSREHFLSVNARCLEGFNPFQPGVEIATTPRRHLEPGAGNRQQSSDNALLDGSTALRTYEGSCHCGSVTIVLHSDPLSDPNTEVKEDNCSICVRNAFIGVYPHKSKISIHGEDCVNNYRFGRKFNGWPFCRTCGGHVFGILHGPPQAIVSRMTEGQQKRVKEMLEIVPVNVRALNIALNSNDGDEWAAVQRNIKQNDEGTEGYELPKLE